MPLNFPVSRVSILNLSLIPVLQFFEEGNYCFGAHLITGLA